MSRSTISIILIIISVAAYFTIINPEYKNIGVLQGEKEEFNVALDRARELQKIRDELNDKFNAFTRNELDKLEKILPDNVDNVRLILDLDGIASKYDMTIKNVSLVENQVAISGVQESSEIGEISLSFSVGSPYGEFKRFIRDLEQSLRIVDIQKLSFNSDSDGGEGSMNYNITIKTYWLK
jgi:Tfp pilus assembly protein PilO